MTHPLRFASLLALAALAGACATTVDIRSMQPGPVAIGPATQLVHLDGEGRRSAREFVAHELVRQCRARGYFRVEDRSEEGLEVRLAGRQARVQGGEFALQPDQAGLRIDVLEWSANRDEDEIRTKDESGRIFSESLPVMKGHALLAITLFAPDGRAFLAETEYDGWASTPPDTARDEAIEQAARNAVAHFLNDVTPTQVVTRVRLDDDDEGQEAILESAARGAVAQAVQDLERYLEQNPHSASAAYNLAVLLEAMGQYEQALAHYDRALSLGGKDDYSRARAGCARRLAADEALRAP